MWGCRILWVRDEKKGHLCPCLVCTFRKVTRIFNCLLSILSIRWFEQLCAQNAKWFLTTIHHQTYRETLTWNDFCHWRWVHMGIPHASPYLQQSWVVPQTALSEAWGHRLRDSPSCLLRLKAQNDSGFGNLCEQLQRILILRLVSQLIILFPSIKISCDYTCHSLKLRVPLKTMNGTFVFISSTQVSAWQIIDSEIKDRSMEISTLTPTGEGVMPGDFKNLPLCFPLFLP